MNTQSGQKIANDDLREIPCADCEIVIKRDGTWFHNGSPIGRMELVKLFSTVLRRDENGEYWLQTPVEKVRVLVDAAPYIAVEMIRAGTGRDQCLTFRTNIDTEFTAGPDHPIVLRRDAATGDDIPHIALERGLEARLVTPVYYRLANLAEIGLDADGNKVYGVYSQGEFYPLSHQGAE